MTYLDNLKRELESLKRTIKDTEDHSLEHGASVVVLGLNLAASAVRIAALGARMKEKGPNAQCWD